MTLSISVAVMNQKEVTETFIQSLFQFTKSNFELIITDNESDEETAEYLNQLVKTYENISLIRNKRNVGFGASHNTAVRRAKGRYFAVLNNDIEFFEPWDEKLLDLFQDPEVYQVGPANGVCNTLTPDAKGVFDQNRCNDPDYIEASCMIMRTKQARKYGPFDSVYGIGYFEDTDLSLRIKKSGHKIKTVSLDWIHYRAKTSSLVLSKIDIAGIHFRNENIFRKRWNSYLLRKRFGQMIIIQRKASFGDVLLTTPIVDALKAMHPDSVIGFATHCPDTISKNTQIDYLMKPDMPFQCDLFINLDNTYEGCFNTHIVDAYMKAANLTKVSSKKPKVILNKEDFSVINKLIPTSITSFITIDISNTWKGKEWCIDNYIELISRLKRHNIFIVTIGKISDRTRSIPKSLVDIDLSNVLTIPQTSVAICRSAGFIGSEGLTAHIAQGVSTPALVLYGCTTPKYVSYSGTDAMIQHVISTVECQGCRHWSKPSGVTIICPRDYECMKRITVDQVYDGFVLLMKQFGNMQKTVKLNKVASA